MEHFLDCKGLCCPIPMVKLFKKISSLNVGDTLEIVCDDPAFTHDVKAWCEQTGNTLTDLKKEGKLVTAFIRKNPNNKLG